MEEQIRHLVREEVLFAGIRKPIKSREELIPRMAQVTEACQDLAISPLQHIIRYDTPVDGTDSEVGFIVSAPIEVGELRTHTLRKMHFFALTHHGPIESLIETKRKLFAYLGQTGLSPELENVEIYHRSNPENQDENQIECLCSFLAWPEIYREQLTRVLGPELALEIWAGGGSITPHTLVDERAAWVADSLARLKANSTPDEQFDILSRVALVRPVEDVSHFKQVYEETGDLNAVIAKQDESLKKTPTGGFIDPHWSDGRVLHLSKVAQNRKAYDQAETHEERRRAYCFCYLIRHAQDPQVDPIFCYRAAGWARQLWEPILGLDFKSCAITHSVLKGDPFCAWEYDLPESD